MKQLKETLTQLFRAKPYSVDRMKIYEKVKELEKENDITTHHTYTEDNKAVKVEILKKNNGLYETIDIFTIDNIKVIDLTKRGAKMIKLNQKQNKIIELLEELDPKKTTRNSHRNTR